MTGNVHLFRSIDIAHIYDIFIHNFEHYQFMKPQRQNTIYSFASRGFTDFDMGGCMLLYDLYHKLEFFQYLFSLIFFLDYTL